MRLDLILLERLIEAVAGSSRPQLIKHRLLGRKKGDRRRPHARGSGRGAHLLPHHRVIGDQDIGEIPHSRILRRLERELRRFELKLVRAAGVRHEARSHKHVIHIRRRRRRARRTSGERKCSAEQNPQFPHRPFSLVLGDCCGRETGKDAHGSDS